MRSVLNKPTVLSVIILNVVVPNVVRPFGAFSDVRGWIMSKNKLECFQHQAFYLVMHEQSYV